MQMIINGEYRDASSGKTFENINPYTGELVCNVASGTAEDFEEAARIAKASQPAWAATPFYKRAEIIKRFVSYVREDIDKIAKVVTAEGGKTITDARGELECLCMVFESFLEAARHLYGNSVPLNAEPRTQGDIIFTVREPIGVFVTITPFNFPIELYAHKVAPVIITGNAVIIKPASDTPMAAMMLTELLLKAGVPAGVCHFITGSGREVGAWLAQTENVDGVSFTGSTPVGRELMKGGAHNLQHVFLELGGNDPYVVFDSADMEVAVREAVGGRVYNAGQTCCANKRFIIQNTVRAEFTEKLIEALKKVKIGDPADPETSMGCLVSEKAAKNIEAEINKVVADGGKLLYGGSRHGALIEPTVIEVSKDSEVAKDLEIFGPVFPIIGFDTFDEAVEIANQTSFGLASGVITQDINLAMQFANKVQAGTCVINSSGNYRSVHQPFGGYKQTGIGREGTSHTLYEVTQEKSIVIKNCLK